MYLLIYGRWGRPSNDDPGYAVAGVKYIQSLAYNALCA